MIERIYVIAGSPEFNLNFIERISEEIRDAKAVFAVDRGLDICELLNIPVTWIIGDMDSVDRDILAKYPKEKLLIYNKDKDSSDLELALDILLEQFPEDHYDIVLINADGGRWDHFLFNMLMLFRIPNRIRMLSEYGTLWALEPNKRYTIPIPEGALFSLIPIGRCTGISIKNAQYEIENQKLDSLSTLTLSNIAKNGLTISIKSGNLFFFAEDPLI